MCLYGLNIIFIKFFDSQLISDLWPFDLIFEISYEVNTISDLTKRYRNNQKTPLLEHIWLYNFWKGADP